MKYRLSGLYLITDSRFIVPGRFREITESAVAAGADIIQLREKSADRDEIAGFGRILREVTQKYGIPLIVNDSPEIAAEIGADGVHLGESDPDIPYARRILGKNAIVGVSCYNRIERGIEARSKGADYLAFGTPYSTPTKPDREPTPLSTLAEAKNLLSDIPVFAIGGITYGNAAEVLDTGVDGIAVITSVFGSDDPGREVRRLASLLR